MTLLLTHVLKVCVRVCVSTCTEDTAYRKT